MTRDLSVAVIGAGRMGRTRALAAEKSGAHVRYICDPVSTISTRLAEELLDARVVDSPEEIAWENLDAVFICTPPSVRGNVELLAIRNRVPFFVEKPVGLSASSISNIGAELFANPLINAVGYMNRCRRSVQHVRKWASQQQILGISMSWLVGMYGVDWWSKKDGSGGPVNEQATHLIDLARYLVGEIATVQALAQPNPAYPDLIGSASISWQFENGTMGSMLYSCLAQEKMIRLHVFSEAEEQILHGWDFRRVGDDTTAVAYADRNRIFDCESEQFLQAVSRGKSNSELCSFADALRTQEVVDAIHRSVQSGKAEQVSENGRA